ncbi:MAG: (Fe-S)-binding protein [Lentimicrobiaceae bacterium]|jgi:heterodisulfide reductase subunit C|nr:(Fe-S)-binding protein [Lentimicrobiaceae bacterium]
MTLKQIIFIIALLITFIVFGITMWHLFQYFRFTKKLPLKNLSKRFWIMIKVAGFQTKIMRRPVIGFMHALVFWGFVIILIGSIEMVIDGLFGFERIFGVAGVVYDIVIGLGDVFAFIIAILILCFLFRRIFMHIKRFYGSEMTPSTKKDANLALSMILLLMITLLGTNIFYVLSCQTLGIEAVGCYPVSTYLATFFGAISPETAHLWHEVNWWSHILLICLFANILPYSKHFHVFLSVPNVFVSRIEPLGYVRNMYSITKEVKLMLDPSAPVPETEDEPEKFGVSDATDVTWVHYMNALSCTQCGRCTDVCPANNTGKKLSPRKIMMDLRARMNEKGKGLIKNGTDYDDGKSLINDYITVEELWACTQCNACAQECPVNINQPSLILDMRRYLVLEKSEAPSGLNTVFTNIENNGAPWQFSPEDRLNWADELYMNVK